MIDVVADEVRRGVHNESVHEDSFRAAGPGDVSDGVDCVFIYLAVPSELREPDVVLGVDFCEAALGKVDFAVVAEAVGIYRQVVSGPVVSVYFYTIGVTEAAANIGGFYPRPAGTTGIAVEVRGVFYAVEAGAEGT